MSSILDTCIVQEMRTQLLNEAESCVDELLAGLVSAHPGLSLDPATRAVSVPDRCPGHVALVSGGGSGHEPFPAGYVGRGMLTAAVAGSVFASPPPANILAAVTSAARGSSSGVLVVVPNYTGDCLNFGLAVDKTRLAGVDVEMVIVGEDCALDSLGGRAGKRGMCGLLFVYKICGSMSVRGRPLLDLATSARHIALSMATIGVGLSACTLPGSSGPLFQLPPGQMELGLGVHGEAGLDRIKVCSAREAVRLMLARLTLTLTLRPGQRVAVLVNNLGGCSQLEQWVLVCEVRKQLARAGVGADRVYAGLLMTSLDMAGFQISLLRLETADWLRCLDDETEAPGWPGGKLSRPRPVPTELAPSPTAVELPSDSGDGSEPCPLTRECLAAAARAVRANEARLNQLDSGCGDGDCGTTLCRLAEAVLGNLPTLAARKPCDLLSGLASMSESCMGGTSGAVYSLLLTGAGTGLRGGGGDWAAAWLQGLQAVMRYSTARLGDRTMLDALIPAQQAFERHPRSTPAQLRAAVCAAASAAEAGCAATRHMRASVGRASYVRAALTTDVDAGAYAVTLWLGAICKQLGTNQADKE